MVAVLALVSSVLWGTGDFLGGTLSRRKPPLAILGFGLVVGLAVMSVVATVSGSWGSPLGYLPWAVLAGASGMLGLWAFYAALAMGRMGVVSPITATGIVVPLAGGLLVGDIPSPIQATGVAVAIAGLFFVVTPEGTSSPGSRGADPLRRRSVLLAFVAAVMFGTTMASIAQGSLVSPVMTMTSMRLFQVIVMIIIAISLRTIGGMRLPDIGGAAVVGLFDVSANLTYGLAAASGELVIAAVLGSLYPVATVLLAWAIHEERLRALQYLGVGLALLGVVLMSIS